MKSKKFRMLILLLCVLLCACGGTTAEPTTEPPVQESSLPPESSAAAEETPAPTELKANIVKGYSLEEMGFSVVFPEQLTEITDPNKPDSKPYFQSNDYISYYDSTFVNGNSNSIEIWVADNQIAYNGYTLRMIQCYKPSELSGEKDQVRVKDEYYNLAALERYQIYRGDDVMICDLTDLYYEEGTVFEENYRGFAEYLSTTNGVSYEYDNSWLLEQYNYFGDHILEMIYDTDSNPVMQKEQTEGWTLVDKTAENIITFRFVDFKNDPVPGLYIDLYPRVILEPGEKRPDIGPVPVLTGQTDQNGKIIWKNYFPCREGEEYVLQITSAAIGNRNNTNTSSYVLPDLSKLEGSYSLEYVWNQA